MTPADMAALHAACFTTPRPWSAKEFEAVLADPLCFTLFESQGLLVGRAVAGEAEILTLAVDATARRQGLGHALINRFLAEAKTRGAALAFLEVSAQNQAALSLYMKAGFAEVGRRKSYYAQPHGTAIDALVLSRPL